MAQNNFLNITKRVQRKTSVVQRWQEASEIYIDTEGRGRALDLLTALSQRVVEDFSPYKLNDLLKDKGAKGKISTQTKHMFIRIFRVVLGISSIRTCRIRVLNISFDFFQWACLKKRITNI